MKATESTNPKATRAAAVALRLALAAGFLSAVADRFGLWGKPGAPGVAWGDWSNFISYTSKLNWFLPRPLIQPVAALATLLETILAVGLLAGFWLRGFALASCGLLLLFALSMTVAIGIKPPLDYSVYTAAAGAALLGTAFCDHKRPDPKSPLTKL
ncbi:MAG TPA: hypothetical protein VL361_00230 [Candidatus Limnocylindrales bacterium]|jgi:uncharacterized membrane protein YphA (DoxX/SURF4 family)|nr:hypothetical protein [Candidatus Limnocylindrales bacterium]